MEITVSNLPYLGFMIRDMKALQPEYGIEIFIEYGNSFFWTSSIQSLMEGRIGSLTIHGPCINTNLASDKTDWKGVIESYKWTFELYNKFNAKHCVLHPHGMFPDWMTRYEAQQLTIDRVSYIADLAEKYGVELLVENMPYKNLVFSQDEFVDAFSQVRNVNFLIDTGHVTLTNWNMTKLIKDLNKRIKAYHINDNNGEIDSHQKVGEGIIEWESFFKDVMYYSPDARLVLEYYHGPIDEIVRSIDIIKKYCDANRPG